MIDRVGRQVERAVERKAKVNGRDADTTDERREVAAGTKCWHVWRLTVNTARITMQPSVVDCSTSVPHLVIVWVVHLSKRHRCAVSMYVQGPTLIRLPGMLLVITASSSSLVNPEAGRKGQSYSSDVLKIFSNKMVFDGEPLIGMPPPENVSVTLTFDPVTLKNLVHIMNIYAKFH